MRLNLCIATLISVDINRKPATGEGPVWYYAAFLVVVAIGVWLRLDQFSMQVLLDDEWHVVHQLLSKSPGQLISSFGQADFSIPLALFYWLELKTIGLGEMEMRWPMMVAGIAAIAIFPAYVRRYLGEMTALVFAFLLAISPLLVIYSKTARPYSLTILLSMLAMAVFYRFAASPRPAPWWGFAYFSATVLCGWLHLITVPMLFAPFLTVGLSALFARNFQMLGRLFVLGLVTTSGLVAVLLPAFLGDPGALGNKLGAHHPSLETLYGAWFSWLGTSSVFVVLVGLSLAAVGAGRAWRKLPILPGLLTGLALTAGIIAVINPMWSQNPQTFARYLLPATPILLLLMATGIAVIGEQARKHWGKPVHWVIPGLVAGAVAFMACTSPLQRLLANPNSNQLHSLFRMDFRDEKNRIIAFQNHFPISPYWNSLASFPSDSLKITVSPFYFETYKWDAVRWEQRSGQRVMPGNLTGLCVDQWWGEAPQGSGYRFRNVAYLSNPADTLARGFDLVVFQKPARVNTGKVEFVHGEGTEKCEHILRSLYGPALYEDEYVVVFPTSGEVRAKLDVGPYE